MAIGLAVVLLWVELPERRSGPNAPESQPDSAESVVLSDPVTAVSPLNEGPSSARDTTEKAELPTAEVPAARIADATIPTRIRVEEEEGAFPYIRYEDEMAQDPDTGEPVVVRSVAMLADHVMLTVPDEADGEQIRASIETLGYTVSRSWSFSPAWQIGLGRHDPDAVPEAVAAIAAALPDLVVGPDFVYRPFEVPDDYDSVMLWGLKKIQAPAAWSVSTGSPEVMAAIIDSGADLSHPDLIPNLWVNPGEIAGNRVDDDGNGLIDDVNGWDFVGDDNRPDDEGRHGTHVAGTVSAAGDNGLGVVGVNWNTKLIIARVGDQSFPSSALIGAVKYVTRLRESGVNVVVSNNSYGGTGFEPAMRDAIQDAQEADIIFVAAAGNDGFSNDSPGNASYPASYDVDNIISVASSNLADELSIFSNYGSESVDLAAPGSAIRSTIPIELGYYGYLSGTSMASPHVAGAVALLKSAEPDLNWRALRDQLFDSVDPIPALRGRVATGGRLNLRRLLGLASERLQARISSPSSRVIVLDDVSLVLNLTGSITGDAEDVAVNWASVLGPASVDFSQPGALETGVTFSQPGVYQLRFQAISPVETSEDEVTVVVATPEVTDQGLVGFWKFEETSGTVAQDSSVSNRDGTMNGAGRFTGLIGKAAQFDGDDDSVTFASPVTEKVTISAWVRSDSLGEDVFPRILETASPTDTTLNPDFIFYFGRRTGLVDADINSIKFYASKSDQDGIWHTATNTIGDGQWLHVAVSYDGSDQDNFPSIFLNGELLPVGVDARSGDEARGVVGDQTLTPGTAYIGENAAGTRAWDGLIDEVRFYTRALNRAEVAWIAAENRVRPILDARIRVSDELDLLTPFTVTAEGLFSGFGRTYRWEQESGEPVTLLSGATSPRVTVFASTGGARKLRLIASDGEVTVVNSVAFSLDTGVKPIAGSFRGSFQAGYGNGSVWAEVDASGQVGFLGLDETSGMTLAASGIEITADGRFEFEASDGSVIRGQFVPDGFIGASEDGRIAFTGDLVSDTTEGPAEALFGPVINSEDSRVHVWLNPDGSFLLVGDAEGDNLPDGGRGSLNPDGSFEVGNRDGTGFAGQVDLDLMEGRGTIVTDSEVRMFYLASAETFAGERLANISTRGLVGEDDAVMIAGFVVEGGPQTRALLRGIGPSLAGFGLAGYARGTTLTLRRNEAVLASNQGWASNPNASTIETISERLGAFALESETGDSALLADLTPGAYTVALENPMEGDGLALLEVYDAGDDASVRLINLSTRGPAGLDENSLIAGFVLNETLPRRVLVRAIGPGLESFGVDGFMIDPQISLIGDDGLLAENNDWESDDGADLITDLGRLVGAFDLETGSRDSALVRYLDPGRYTVQVEPAEGEPGITLVEIYVVPDFE